MRHIVIVVLQVLFLFSTLGLAQTEKPCDQVRSDGAKLLDSTMKKQSLDERLALLKPVNAVVLNLDTCRLTDFLNRDIVMLNMDADIESELSAFMYDQAAELAKRTAELAKQIADHQTLCKQ